MKEGEREREKELKGKIWIQCGLALHGSEKTLFNLQETRMEAGPMNAFHIVWSPRKSYSKSPAWVLNP